MINALSTYSPDFENQKSVHNPDHYKMTKDIIPVIKLKAFLESREGEPFFLGENDEIGCMDGRVKPEGALGLAGSGILLPRSGPLPEEKYLAILTERAKKGFLKTITWHRGYDAAENQPGYGGCGAAKLYLKQIGISDFNEDRVAQEARSFADALAAEINRRLTEEGNENRVISLEVPGEGDHAEEGCYIDFTDSLDLIAQDPNINVQLPNGFMHNPRLTDDSDYLLKEIEIAIKIAFSDHGKNGKEQNYFTAERPFFIHWVESDKKPLSDEERKKWEGFPHKIRKMIEEKYPQYAAKIAGIETIRIPR